MARITVTGPAGVGGEVEVENGTNVTIGGNGEIHAFAADGTELSVEQVVPEEPQVTGNAPGEAGEAVGGEGSADDGEPGKTADDAEEHGDA